MKYLIVILLTLAGCRYEAHNNDSIPVADNGPQSRPSAANAPVVEISGKTVDRDLLSAAALRNLNGKLILLNSYDAAATGTKEELEHARQSIINTRAWAVGLADRAYREAVLDWTDYAERHANEYEKEMNKGVDHSKREREQREFWEERARVNELARTLPKPE